MRPQDLSTINEEPSGFSGFRQRLVAIAQDKLNGYHKIQQGNETFYLHIEHDSGFLFRVNKNIGMGVIYTLRDCVLSPPSVLIGYNEYNIEDLSPVTEEEVLSAWGL